MAWQGVVDEQGRLVLPGAAAAHFGLAPGAQVRLEAQVGGLMLRRATGQLAKLYIEPTNCCNLACRTCVRNVWDEPLGTMSEKTFAAILDGLRRVSPPPTVFFGGFGEPLAHHAIVEMVSAAKALGSRVELITNGTLLTERLARSLIAAKLDRLWVSLDGARPDSYADVRLGAALPQVIANLARFRDMRSASHLALPQIGVAFVAMRRNLADLPDVLSLGRRLGASHFMVSNVLPYSDDMRGEVLYSRALTDLAYLPSAWTPDVRLPKIDISQETQAVLFQVLQEGGNISIAGANLGVGNDRCPFVEAGAAAVGWDGTFSPCLPLLHSHASFLNDRPRFSRRYAVGRLADAALDDLWRDPGHQALRERVQAFSFSPCSFCGGCEYSETNEEDCFGNTFPTCGGCLWAQGVVQCP